MEKTEKLGRKPETWAALEGQLGHFNTKKPDFSTKVSIWHAKKPDLFRCLGCKVMYFVLICISACDAPRRCATRGAADMDVKEKDREREV